jgi:serine protease Do
MNRKNVVKLLAIGTLGVCLAALPGSSAKLQNPEKTGAAPQPPRVISIQKMTTRAVPEAGEMQAPEADDFEIFVGDGGSWLGVETREVSAESVKQLKLPAERGALVGKIVPDSPAVKAGLKENDVISEVNGQRVEGTAQFRRLIREIPAGRTVQLTVLRDGRSQTISATLGKSESRHPIERMGAMAPGAFAFRVHPEGPEMPEIAELGDMRSLEVFDIGQPRLGIDAEDLQGELGAYFGAPEGQGVLVRSVVPDSAAAKAGLKSGDVITTLNGQRIQNIRELHEQMRSLKDDKAAKLGLLRNKSEISLNVVLPAPAEHKIRTPGERRTM